MQQLPLGVRIPDRRIFATFLTAGNEQTVAQLQALAGGERGGVAWLYGALAAGKSHLLQAACVLASEHGRAGYVPLAEFERLGTDALEGLPQLDCVCLDDLHVVAGQREWEAKLFGLYREMEERGSRLIVSALHPPAYMPWSLKDLGSRFAAATLLPLATLAEAQQREALKLHAHARGFELPEETAQWLQRRHPRDMASMCGLLDTLDEAGLAAQRRLTIPFIRSVLGARQQP